MNPLATSWTPIPKTPTPQAPPDSEATALLKYQIIRCSQAWNTTNAMNAIVERDFRTKIEREKAWLQKCRDTGSSGLSRAEASIQQQIKEFAELRRIWEEDELTFAERINELSEMLAMVEGCDSDSEGSDGDGVMGQLEQYLGEQSLFT